MTDTLTDIMSLPKAKRYTFNTQKVLNLIDRWGNRQLLAVKLGCNERTITRAVNNRCANRRLQRDILSTLGITEPLHVGSIIDVL